jgi:hypothetical protein
MYHVYALSLININPQYPEPHAHQWHVRHLQSRRRCRPTQFLAHPNLQASSAAFSQEPFDTFVDKVRLLLGQLFADAHSSSTAIFATIYRLQGGGFHRVINIAADLLDCAVVIRIPRFEFVPLADEAAVLSFVRQLPVLHVLKLDTSSVIHIWFR